VFRTISSALVNIYRELSGGPSSARGIDVKSKMQWYNEVYAVAIVHPAIAKEFFSLLEKWASGTLIPLQRSAINAAVGTSSDDRVFHEVSRSFTCFELIVKIASFMYSGVESCDRTGNAASILYTQYRESFYGFMKPTLQRTFFSRVSRYRQGLDESAADLKPIADIFLKIACAGLQQESPKVYTEDFLEPYMETMVADNRKRVEEMLASGCHADEIATWLNSRADFESRLASVVVQPAAHHKLMSRYDDRVVAPLTVDLIRHPAHGFAARFREGSDDNSFKGAIDLFVVAARVEKQHPSCVAECASQLKAACIDRVNVIIDSFKQQVYESPVAAAGAIVGELLREQRLMDSTIKRMRNHPDLQRARREALTGCVNQDNEAHPFAPRRHRKKRKFPSRKFWPRTLTRCYAEMSMTRVRRILRPSMDLASFSRSSKTKITSPSTTNFDLPNGCCKRPTTKIRSVRYWSECSVSVARCTRTSSKECSTTCELPEAPAKSSEQAMQIR